MYSDMSMRTMARSVVEEELARARASRLATPVGPRRGRSRWAGWDRRARSARRDGIGHGHDGFALPHHAAAQALFHLTSF